MDPVVTLHKTLEIQAGKKRYRVSRDELGILSVMRSKDGYWTTTTQMEAQEARELAKPHLHLIQDSGQVL